MGQAQSQTTQLNNPQNQHLQQLLNNSIMAAHYIQGMSDQVSFTIKCPRCLLPQFDDGLGRSTNCYNCQLIYSVNDGIASIKEDLLQIDDKRVHKQRDSNFPILDSLVLYVNHTKLPTELMPDGKVDYKTILKNVVIPFFSIRSRVITAGAKFLIGQFEFRCCGGSPIQGVVNERTQIYCYGSYGEDSVRSIKVLSQLRSAIVEQEIKQYMMNNQNENQVIKDIYLRINHNDLLILQCDNQSGKVSNHTRIESVNNVQRLKNVKLCCLSMPQIFRQLPQIQENAKNAILQAIIFPYFTGLTRFLERGQMLSISDFEFQVYFEEEQGLVIPSQTQLDLEIGSWRQPPIQQQQQQQYQQQQQQHIRIQSIFQARRGELNRQHAQQIEALHRLLSSFILLHGSSHLVQNGTPLELINQLPVRQIDVDKIKQLDEDHLRCLICLSEYEQDDVVMTMPCWHYFHRDCLDKWLGKSNACPICKTAIGE